MKIVTEPKVYLVGRQSIDDRALDDFLHDHGVDHWTTDTDVAGEKLVEVAGRLCYMSYAKPRPGGNSAYLGHIKEVGHGSVLEHSVFNLIITGVSRSFTHELVRHRAGFGFSQLSQRYVDESDCDFVVPPALVEEVSEALDFYERYQDEHSFYGYADAHDRCWIGASHTEQSRKIMTGLLWLSSNEVALERYARLSSYLFGKFSDIEDKTLRRKKAREAARSVLPNATETKIFVTANARALRHFIEMRAADGADAEMRAVAREILRVMKSESPNLFDDYDHCGSTPHRKV